MGSLEDLCKWQGGLASSSEGAVEIRGKEKEKKKSLKEESLKEESFSLPRKLKIRKETKKRAGHVVFVLYDIEGENLSYDYFCKMLKNSLACGGSVQENTIIVQCSQIDSLYRFLNKKGIKYHKL